MVIELSGVQFGLCVFKIEEREVRVQFEIKYDFRLKLHDPKCNCHFITSILKSHYLISKYENYNILVSTVIY